MAARGVMCVRACASHARGSAVHGWVGASQAAPAAPVGVWVLEVCGFLGLNPLRHQLMNHTWSGTHKKNDACLGLPSCSEC